MAMIWWILGATYAIISALIIWVNYEKNYPLSIPWSTWLAAIFWLPIIVLVLILFIIEMVIYRDNVKCEMPHVEMKGMENG